MDDEKRKQIASAGRNSAGRRYVLRMWVTAAIVAPPGVGIFGAGFGWIWSRMARTLLGGRFQYPGFLDTFLLGFIGTGIVLGACAVGYAVYSKRAAAGRDAFTLTLGEQRAFGDHYDGADTDTATDFGDYALAEFELEWRRACDDSTGTVERTATDAQRPTGGTVPGSLLSRRVPGPRRTEAVDAN